MQVQTISTHQLERRLRRLLGLLPAVVVVGQVGRQTLEAHRYALVHSFLPLKGKMSSLSLCFHFNSCLSHKCVVIICCCCYFPIGIFLSSFPWFPIVIPHERSTTRTHSNDFIVVEKASDDGTDDAIFNLLLS